MSFIHITIWFALVNLWMARTAFHDDVAFPNIFHPARPFPDDLTLFPPVLNDLCWPASEPRNLDKLVEPNLDVLADYCPHFDLHEHPQQFEKSPKLEIMAVSKSTVASHAL